ncbi:MAG TPA: aldo/keto reductase, partial [Thermotogota bacterium]|nr:aldo/keto reductase [Thermotogota bacterium]
MEYRLFGKTGVEVSILGFGMMRLPILNNDPGQIDKAEATRMVRMAIDQGVNYIDTAYGYHKGQSEHFTREALGDGYRDKVFLATKMPTYLVKEKADFERFFQEQKTKLGTDRIDMYLLHTLNQKRWDLINGLDVLEFLEEKRKAGEIRFFGFSFHDDYPAFESIVNTYDWDFCQIQFNYMDTEVQAGLRGLRLAHAKGMALIVMEPIKGGKLANP